jgi:N6-adenosine-specific RNA methylase IME4
MGLLGRSLCPFEIPKSDKKMGILTMDDYKVTDVSADFPDMIGKYRAIEWDCPWRYSDSGFNGYQSVQKYRIHCPYPTMSLPELWLMGDGIKKLAADRCLFWCWASKDFLYPAMQMCESWGLHFKQIFTWIKTTKAGKPTYGMGYWCRNACEFLLLYVNEAKDNRPLEATTTPNYILAPATGHSAKPEAAMDLIRRNSPGPRLSIFQRTPREGFDCYGNQMPDAPLDEPRADLISAQGDPS